ncbi:MAG: CvpA family protein [Chloroflexota bacterium]|nr:CvpA family protein [Chloroflexota bacterium]
MPDVPSLPALPPHFARDWHPLDVALGVCLAIVALNAARRGFVREAGTLVGLAIGLAVAGRFGPQVADRLAEQVGRLPLLDELAYALVVGLVAAGATVLAGVLRGTLRLPGLPIADHLAGLALGVIEGAAALGLLLLLAMRVGLVDLISVPLDGSTLAPVFLRWWLIIATALPPELGMPRSIW